MRWLGYADDVFICIIWYSFFKKFLSVTDIDGQWGEWGPWSGCSVSLQCQRGGIRKRFSHFYFENGYDLFSLGYETVPSPHHRGTGQTVRGISGRRNIVRGRQREAAVSKTSWRTD